MPAALWKDGALRFGGTFGARRDRRGKQEKMTMCANATLGQRPQRVQSRSTNQQTVLRETPRELAEHLWCVLFGPFSSHLFDNLLACFPWVKSQGSKKVRKGFKHGSTSGLVPLFVLWMTSTLSPCHFASSRADEHFLRGPL